MKKIRYAMARARLLPLRLTILTVTCIALLICLWVTALKSKALQQAQFNAQTLLGLEVWKLKLAELDTYSKLFPKKGFLSNDWLTDRLASPATLTVVKAGPLVIGHPSHSSKQTVLNQLFVSERLGLPILTQQGLPACAVLNVQNLLEHIGSVWILSNTFRCEIVAPPKNWLVLNTVSDMPSLVLHAAHMPTRLNSYFTVNVDWVIIEKNENCTMLQAISQLPFVCQTLAVTRSATAKASEDVVDTQIKLTKITLAATALAYLIYLHGFFPLLYVEAAIRVALGQRRWIILRWLCVELLLQSILAILFPLLLLGIARLLGYTLPMLNAITISWLLCLFYLFIATILLTTKKLPQAIANLGKVN